MRMPLAFLLFLPALAGGQSRYNHGEYGPNIITALAFANNAGPGFGLQYERFFGERLRLSVAVPLSFCYSYAPASTSGHGYNGGPSPGRDQRPLMVFFAPGIRFYPTASSGVVRYSIGASVIYGHGKGVSNSYTGGTANLTPRSIVGLLIGNAVHVQPTPHFRISIELGLGIGEDDGLNSAAGTGTNPLGQISFAIGYRF